VLAVVTTLGLTGGDADGEGGTQDDVVDEAADEARAEPGRVAEPSTARMQEPSDVVELSPRQREAVQHMWDAAVELIDRGVAAAGSGPRASLLRAVHACRVAGLHRLAAGGTRLIQSIADLAADQAHFDLGACA